MGTREFYKISLEMLNQYDNMLGIDTFDGGFRDIELDDEDVTFRHTDCLIPELPQEIATYSNEMAKYLNLIIERLCMEFGNIETSLIFQTTYVNAIEGILNTALSLNLIPDDSEDYVLIFNRCSAIMLYVLEEMSSKSYEDIILFWQSIKDLDITDIMYNWAKKMPYTASFVYLAMNGNTECKDYEIFEDNSSSINSDKLNKMVKDNTHINREYEPILTRFNRMTYYQAKKISSKS